MKRFWWTTMIGVAAVGLAACTASEPERPAEAQSLAPEARQAKRELPPTPLMAEEATRDLGAIGIGDGLVETDFRVTNGADSPTGLVAVYTSCMCTEVTLEFEDGTTAGPFGMPGHELPVTLQRMLAPGEGFDVRATFDPMAHGPDAVGPVQRAIALHSDNGGMLQLDFAVNVVKEASAESP